MTTLTQTSALWAQERRQYRLIFALSFAVIVAIAFLARLLPLRLRPWPPVGDAHLSLIAEARAVTQRVLPFAFL
jgi:hypothetical protein